MKAGSTPAAADATTRAIGFKLTLWLTDASGCVFETTDTVTILFTNIDAIGNIHNITLYPNPSDEFPTLSVTSTQSGVLSWTLQDILGRTVVEFPPSRIEAGDHKYTIELPAPGTYILLVTIDNSSQRLKVVHLK
jgi:hypothetical protein